VVPRSGITKLSSPDDVGAVFGEWRVESGDSFVCLFVCLIIIGSWCTWAVFRCLQV
jgi:hypothetical protein